MKNLKYILLSAVLVASVAFAIKQVKYSEVNDPNPQWFSKGFYVGPRGPSTPVVNDTKNQVTGIYGGSYDYDFPAVAPGYAIHNTLKTFTLTGVKVGDPCLAAVSQVTANGNDGGSASPFGMDFNALVRAKDIVELIAENTAGDGGTFDMPDANYTIRCISNQ